MLTGVRIISICTTLVVGGYSTVSLATERSGSQEATSAIEWQRNYDDQGRVIELRGPGGKTTRIQYTNDKDGRLKMVTKTYSDGTKVSYDYNPFGRRIGMTDALGNVRYEYDGFNRLIAVRRQDSPAITYTYDTLDRLQSISVDKEFTLTYSYDFLGRLAKMDTPAGVISYEYQNGQGQVIRTLPNGIRTVWEYHPNGHLAAITHVRADDHILAQFNYDYQPDGLIKQITELSLQGKRVIDYQYDTAQRLTAVTDSQGSKTEYRYDEVGNRTALTAAGAPTVFSTHDWAGRLVSQDGQPCNYDLAGNLVSCLGRLGNARFEYNGANLLKTVVTEKESIQYQYSGDDRLITRMNGKEKTLFIVDSLTDNWRPLMAIHSNGERTVYLWEGDMPLATITNGDAQFFLHDHLGSIRYVTDRKGQPIFKSDYSPFGEPRQSVDGKLLQPGFTGLFLDSDAQLYLTRARAYDPALGLFLQPDPEKTYPVRRSGRSLTV